MRKPLLVLSFFLTVFLPRIALADVEVALVAPLTGNYAVFGEQLRQGAMQAVADTNAKGGVLGQKIVLKEFDDACDPKQAVAVAGQIVNQNIKFVIGYFCSSTGLAAESTLIDNEILLISPAVSHPKFTEDANTFVFRVGLRNELQGHAIADYLLKHFAKQNIAILNDKGAYGQMLASVVKQSLNDAGKQEILFDSYDPGQKDYSTLTTLLKQKKADVVMIGGYHTEVGLIIRQLRQQNVPTVVIGGTPLMTRELWSITGAQGEGTLMAFGPDPRKRAEAKAAVASLRKTGFEPEGYTIYSYAAAQVLAEGIASANSLKTLDVAAALRKATYPTVIGDLRFDAKGDVQKPELVIYKWHNGDYSETN
jgi:branched-chain amino acid transport system substrate-binding protein